MNKIIFFIIYLVLVFVAEITSKGIIENTYSFKGVMTYEDVFVALSDASFRSVLGETECLKLSRQWYINNKKFSVVVDQIRKNLLTDGYSLYFDTSCFFVKRIDTTIQTVPERVFKKFLKFSKKYIITKDEETYLNADYLDSLDILSDSLKLEKSSRRYRIRIDLIGSTQNFLERNGVSFDDVFRLNIDIYPSAIPRINIGLNASANNLFKKLNFKRTIITYMADTSTVFHFGTEQRRIQGKIESDRILTENFESVFEGLTVTCSNPFLFYVSYRIDNSTIDLVAVPDSLVSGIADIASRTNGKSFFILPSRGEENSNFRIYVKISSKRIM